MSLVKITLLLQNVSSPGLMESILEARWRKVCFFDKFLLEESFLAELVGELGLLEKIILHPPTTGFCGRGPGEKAEISLYLTI